MCRSKKGAQWVVVGLVLGVAAVVQGDEVAAYLERHGLDGLLAVHLEERLKSVGGDERESLVLQLVGIYARLLESTEIFMEFRLRNYPIDLCEIGVHLRVGVQERNG